ncbi:hypothetical protein HPB47_021270, partial [Ixodes persulcatus]
TSPQYVFALDFELNPLDIEADYGLMLYAEPVEVVYHEHSVSELLTFFSVPTVSAEDLRNMAVEQLSSLVTWSRTGLLYALTHRRKDEDTKMDPTTEELKLMRHHINRPPDAGGGKHSRSSTQLSIAGSEQYLSASDYSDEEQEVWGRALDVPGFDDNVSASNTVNSLLRFVLGEVALHLSRSSDQLDKPYLMLRLDKLCADVALMEYGPAVQASISGIHLVDKLHIGPTGEYLELLSSKANGDMFSMLYRKVKASCPEFKSDFHQVEHSLIVDLSSVSITFHREALLTLGRYLLYVYQKLNIKEPVYRNIIPESAVKRASYLFVEDSDPPVPPGSTKLSLSLRVREVKARLCDVDVELADISICGLECDYVQKANEKLIVRVDLTHLSIDDLMESTLYSKVLSIEDDKLFDFKYVRKAPHTRAVDMDEDKSKIVPDGNVRLHIGRLQLVLLRRFFVDVQRFLEPFLLPEARSLMFQSAEKAVQQQVADFAQKSVMLQLSIDIRAPTILVPQKSDSPNLVVLSLGDLNMENFFKEVSWGPSLTTAIVLLDGTTQSQESILEPTKLNLDIKRALTPYHRNILEYEVRGTMDLIKISIGQKDLGTILAIFRDNFKEKEVIEPHKQASTPVSPPVLATPTITDDPVKKLATFLTTSVDVYKKTNIFLTMEGLHIVLYADGEDIQLSSPVRDPLQMLSKLELEEVTVNFDLCSDQSLEQRPSVAVDVLIEETSLKVSVPYLLAVLSFVHESLLPPTPSEHELRPVIEGAGAARQHGAGVATSRKRLPSDNTSGYHSAVGAPAPEDGASGLSFSLVLKKPEIVFFADPRDRESEVIVLKMDIMLDYCRNLGQRTMTASVIGLNASSFLWGRKKDTHYLILKPFNIELNQTLSISDADVKLSAKMSDVASSHFCSCAVHRDDASGHERPTYPVSTPAESLEISVPKVTLVYENYTVRKKVPVLFFQASVEADVHDWSKQMYLTAEAKLEALYYSEERSTWEPLIDPIMERENYYRPWELVIKMFKDRSYPILSAQDSRGSNMLVDMMDGTEENSHASCGSMTSSDDASEEETEMTVIRKHPAPRAKRALSQKSRDSSTLVAVDSDSENDENVLQRIAHAFGHLFSDQSSEGEQSDEGEGAPDVKSESEETETADNEISTTDDRPVFLGKGKSSFQYGLQSRDSEAVTTPQDSHLTFQEKPLCDLYKERTTEKISLENKMRYFFIVEVSIENGRKTVTTRSPLRLENHLPRPVQLLCARSSLEAVGVSAERYAKNPFHGTHVRLATLAPKEVYHVPLFVAYHSKIYLQPSSVTQDCAGYELSTDGLWSQDIALCHKSAKFLSCKSKNPRDKQPFWMKVVCKESRDARVPALGTMFVPNCTLHVVPPIVIHNSLPYPIELHFKESSEEVKLDEGDLVPVFSIAPNEAEQVSIEVPYYLGSSWRGQLELSGNLEEAKGVQMQPQQAQPERMHRQLCISIQLTCDCSLEVFLYSPYWVINKTGLPLQIRGSNSDVIYDSSASSEELLLFRFKKRKHKKAKIRVYNSSWSSSFCLDTVGNNGVVVCKDKERNKKYRFFLKIQMSKLKLSKIISITPFFLVVNNTRHYFRFMEENEAADLWFDIGPLQCLPFWPDTDSMKMYVRHKDSNVSSQHFCFKEVQNTVLRMDSGSAVCVEVSGGVDGPMKISLFPYHNGDAPVRVENLCEDLFLKIHQKCLGQVTLLSPYQSVLYTWDDPTLERTLMWNLYNRKKPGFMAHIGRAYDSESENGVLPKKTRKDIVVVFWISFLDHHQRVLLFTQDERVWKHARKAVDGEKAQLECFVSLHGVGVSLMNGALVEVALLSFSSSPALWEVKVNDAWKPLTLELASWLEYRWRSRHKSAELKDYVDLEKMQMTKPFYGSLQRSYRPALWLQYRQSEHQGLVLAKVHRLQLDNQLPDAVFPTAMYRFMPQERKLASSPRPLLEVALLVHRSERLNLNTIKYLKVLLQEMYIKLDKGFLLSVYDIFSGIFTEDDEIHLSFSPRGTTHKSVSDFGSLPQDILDVFLNSIGATLSEVKDVELRMAYFEQKGRLETVGDLLTEVKSHYISQVKRRQRMEQHPGSLPEALALATRGFVHGILLGVSGVVMSPIAGAQLEGPEGFFKGVGKGLLGLITKPAGGVVDMFSIAFDGIRRAAEMGKGVIVRHRLPRFINPNLGLRPFSQYQATGYRLLLHLSKGHYSETDVYWAHAPLGRDERASIALLTDSLLQLCLYVDRHLFLLEKCRFWGGWDIQWSVRLEDILSVPTVSGNSLVIKVRQDESLASFTGDERHVVCEDQEVLEWLKLKVEKVLLTNMEERPCSLDS